MKRLLLVVFAMVLVVGACSDDSGVLSGESGNGESGNDQPAELDGDERAAAQRVADSIKNDPEAPEITTEEADCVGARVVESLGVDRVEAIDWEANTVDMDEDDARGVAKALVSCVDVRPLLVEGMTEDGDLTTEQAECLSEDLTDSELETLLAVSFTEGNGDPDPALYEPFADAALNCMDFGALLVQQFTSDGNLSEESATCLADAIPHDLLRDLIIVGMTDGDSTSAEAALTREITRAAPDCLTDEELASLGG